MSVVLNIVNICRVCMQTEPNNEEQKNLLQETEICQQFYFTTQIKVYLQLSIVHLSCFVVFLIVRNETITKFKLTFS